MNLHTTLIYCVSGYKDYTRYQRSTRPHVPLHLTYGYLSHSACVNELCLQRALGVF